MTDEWLRLVGLCQKAGKIASGEDTVLQAVKGRKAYLVIIAEDASHNTRKRFTDKCHTYDTAYVCGATCEALGGAIGKRHRAVCAVLDEGFAKAIRERMDTWQRSE